MKLTSLSFRRDCFQKQCFWHVPENSVHDGRIRTSTHFHIINIGSAYRVEAALTELSIKISAFIETYIVSF